MAEFEQNQVSKTTWNWTASEDEDVAQKTTSHSHKKVLITTPIALGIAFFVYRVLQHTTMACIIVGISLFIAFSAFVMPSVYRSIDGFFQKLAHWIGIGMTWLLLVPAFFILFLPGRIFFLLRGKDPLRLKLLPDESSYWIPHPGVTREEHYRRQH